MGWMVVGLLATTWLAASPLVAAMPPMGRALARACMLGVFDFTLLGLMAWMCGRRGHSLRSAFDLRRKFRGGRQALLSAGVVVALVIATRVVSTAWGAFAQALGWRPPAIGDLTAVFGTGGAGFALAAVVVVLLGPFVEELAFRGVVLSALEAKLGRWWAIGGSALLFAGYHVTAWAFVPLVGLGVALGWLASQRRSLWSAIALHASYNATVVAAAFWLAS